MTPPLRAAVVGLGYLGRHHARIYAELPQVQLVGLCDRRESVRNELPPPLREVPFYSRASDLLGEVDLVSIVTPTSTHLNLAEPFLSRGVPVLVEKPIASSVAEARRLVQVAESSGSILQVGHVEAFNPATEAAGELIDGPRYVECHRLGTFSGRGVDVDVVCDLMIHDLDLLLTWVCAPVRWLHAVGVPVLGKTVDIASVRVEFEDETVATLTASRVSRHPQRQMRVFTANSYIRIDFLNAEVECHRRCVLPSGEISIEIQRPAVRPYEPLRRELECFVATVAQGSRPVVDGGRALGALELAVAIRERVESKQRLVEARGETDAPVAFHRPGQLDPRLSRPLDPPLGPEG